MLGFLKYACYSVTLGASIGAMYGGVANLYAGSLQASYKGVNRPINSKLEKFFYGACFGCCLGGMIPTSIFYEGIYVTTNLFLQLFFNASAPLQLYYVNAKGYQTGWKDKKFMWCKFENNEEKETIKRFCYEGAKFSSNIGL